MINTSAQKFISYDNEQSMKLKGQYARENNACGVIVWEISGDRIGGSNPLAAALNQGLCGTVGIDEQQQLEAYVYPNPANDFVTISLVNSTTNNQVAVYNALGQMVISQRFNQSMFSISLKELEPGIYFINIANESGVASKKIVKE
jgi:GH18 family chitinase